MVRPPEEIIEKNQKRFTRLGERWRVSYCGEYFRLYEEVIEERKALGWFAFGLGAGAFLLATVTDTMFPFGIPVIVMAAITYVWRSSVVDRNLGAAEVLVLNATPESERDDVEKKLRAFHDQKRFGRPMT